MSQVKMVMSLGYWFSAYTLGLMLHPYKTMRELVREKRFRALILAPLVFWLIAWLGGLVIFQVGGVILEWLGLVGLGEVLLSGLALMWWWLSVFLLMWQGLLLYLSWRFWGIAKN